MFSVEYHTQDDRIRKSVKDFIDLWNDSSSHLTTRTSGSTGTPREIVLKKEHMRASARMTAGFLGLTAEDTALLCLSAATIAGRMMIVRAITVGMRLIVTDVSSVPLHLVSSPISFAAMVPMQVARSLEETPGKLSEIRTLIIGGGEIPHGLRQELSRFPHAAWQTFGMTETISHIALRNAKSAFEPYTVLPGVSVQSLEGRLRIDAPHLGVHDLVTNDLVEICDERHFRWLGRLDFVINSGGVKIHPEQVEEKLSALIEVPFFSAGIPDSVLGEQHILCIEGNPSGYSKEDFRALLPPFEIPRRVFFFPDFVYTESGKINRPETLKQLAHAEERVL